MCSHRKVSGVNTVHCRPSESKTKRRRSNANKQPRLLLLTTTQEGGGNRETQEEAAGGPPLPVGGVCNQEKRLGRWEPRRRLVEDTHTPRSIIKHRGAVHTYTLSPRSPPPPPLETFDFVVIVVGTREEG
ncbi:hypothetical protein HPB50_020981 [Hyalomma asiaticum]|uniref:Uncharacterized protein n=1 Tax=Hyalomma asiaticum TaxID=266040 RepID=A0ACB7T880_HYAAI|nr:hypothetical protein HPB50_020981 [Hyalomma asiaticum]